MSDKTEKIQHDLTQAVITAMSQNPEGWTKPWIGIGGGPQNPQTGTIYSGGNMMILSIFSPDPSDPRWSTYKGWGKLGGQVRKGEAGTEIIFWGQSYVCGICDKWGKSECKSHPGESAKRRLARGYSVFHASQVDDAPDLPEQPVASPDIDVDAYRTWFRSIGADWRETPSDRAFYSPGDDYISTPLDTQFHSAAGWFATVAHEHTHWTKPAARTGRDTHKRSHSGYAFEELVAELGAVFLSNACGVATDPRPDHAAYIKNWLEALAGDTKYVWDAASLASRAVRFLMDNADAIPQVSPEMLVAA